MKKKEADMKKMCLACVFVLLVLASAGFAQQDPPLPPDSGQQIMLNEPPENVGVPPISPWWQARRSWYYTGMVVGNFDGDAYEEVAFDYGSSGIWIYDPNASPQWNQISTDDPTWMISVALSSTADDELIAEFSTGTPNRWWNYSGYPGTWTNLTGASASWAYDAGNIGDGDAGHEFVMYLPSYGLYVFDYTGSGIYGGCNIYKIHDVSTNASGMPIDLDGNGDYELIHYFNDGLRYWNWASGYPATWSSPLTTNFCEIIDCLAMDIDGIAGDEFIADTTVGTWKYEHGSPGTWTRINYQAVLEIYPYASVLVGDNYEVIFDFGSSVPGIWFWDDPSTWERATWNKPDFILCADIDPVYSEEIIGDFGSMGLWVELGGHPGMSWSWTRINWNNPLSMVPANLDADAQKEIVFNFGSIGVWTWDKATNTWTRINWNPPESN